MENLVYNLSLDYLKSCNKTTVMVEETKGIYNKKKDDIYEKEDKKLYGFKKSH